MAADFSVTWTERRRPAEEDICPLEVKSFRTDGGTDVFRTERRSETASTPGTERPTDERQQVTTSVSGEGTVTIETCELSDDEMGRLDIDLDRKSRELNLTCSNVRAILHEVITHERVVAMMKAAIRDTQDLPMFEAKMTRSRLKQAVQQGQPLNWSLSALNSVKPPQFVDIDLEEDEDSSDEEYCPDEEEEEDTAEESFLSDGDSLASPPRMQLGSQTKPPADQRAEESLQRCPAHLREHMRTSTCCPQQLLSAPIESSFMERLNAVEEELDCSSAYTYGQSLDRKPDDDNDDDDGGDEGSSCLAYRTRSKLRLVNIPLGQLEAELLAPDITADMYDQSHAQREEDRHWTRWLQSLMAPDCEDEADDDDDPEYNFVEDLDEPDMEDYRTDRAVQITKKEVNELLEELFDTLKDEDVAAEEEEEEQEEEEAPSQTRPKFNVPQALRFEAPLASMLTERRQTVRKRYEALQQRRALQDTTNQLRNNTNANDTPSNNITSILVLPSWTCPSLHLDYTQRLQLQQQVQQHVQLLTQVHLLSRRIDALNHEACITKHYLVELQHFARRREDVRLRSSFRVCNLQGALDLLQEKEQREEPPPAPPAPPAPAVSRRWLPRMTPATNSHAFPVLPADTAWLFATRSVFLYPELLPVCSLDPALHSRHHRSVYTAGEDGLIVLGLKHFEGTVHSDQLISSYLLCKSRWNFRKHIREMSSSRAPRNNIIKTFLTQGVVPPLPLACSRVQPEDQRPPVDRNTSNIPNWLKNSQQIIQKTRLDSTCYPPTLPPGCALRLHPYWLNRSSRPPPRPHRRLFTLAHNASLLPLAKALTDRQIDLSLPSPGASLLSDPPAVPAGLPLAPAPVSGAIQFATVHPVSSHPDVIQSCRPIGHNLQQNVSEQEHLTPIPFLLPLPSLSSHKATNPIMPCSDTVVKPSYFLLQMMWPPPPAPATTSQHALGYQQPRAPIKKEHEEENNTKPRPTPARVRQRQEWEEKSSVCRISLDGGESSGGEEQRSEGTDGGGDREEEGGEDGQEGEEDREERGGEREDGGGEREDGGGEREDGAEDEEDGGGEREDGGGEREDDGDKDRDEDQDRQGEEEEDFDDLTQDEDEEEVMSSASEESVLSVPELQETMKQLTWLAAERRLCADGDSEEDHSPTSPGSQEEEEEEEEEGPKGEESVEGRSSKVDLDEETPSGERTPRGGRRCPGRGRGRSRPHRSLKRSRQERHSKDAAKLLLLYDENILDNDPHRESKDVAFAQSYLNRVRDALQDVPEQMEEFVSLLNEFEQVGEGEELLLLYRKLRCILGNRVDLLQDFAAFLHPEQALQCGLLEEQQAFERSRRFLRQLEISFGDNPSHYQKIIKALQTGPDLSSTTIHELKAQMATLLKGHTHLQAEFWVFFDELRPPPARPGQFEEAHWPEDGGGGSDGGEGVSQVLGGGACGGFEEVTLPELEEEEEGLKSQPMTNRRQRRKMDGHRNYKDRDWSDKHWSCLCPDAKIRHHRRKECSHCHGNKTSGGVSRAMKSLDPLYSQISSAHDEPGDKDLDLKGGDDSPQPDRSGASWEGPFPLPDEKEEEEEELDDEEGDDEEEERKTIEKEQGLMGKRIRREEGQQLPSITSSVTSTCSSVFTSTSVSSSSPSACTSSTTSSITTSSISSVSPSVTTFSITSFITSITSSSISSISPSVCTSPSHGSSSSAAPRPSPPPDLPVCAKNISLTASGEKVILWTREADRVILTTCQQDGANQDTFQAISSLLGNKTPTEVSRRFRDLMRLFRTAARQTSSEDEAPPTETATANEAED
ncbi:GON-4-like protein [Amphiprion ocellaris]|uniref:GON-4-like protein n=1 Tax=Amphiprion ocellaris TaxID=80972 RepID=UPI0024114D5B|nr:GON-4-like protein [Amphiprion ocellaris]